MIPAQRAEAALMEIEVYVIQGHEVDVIQFIVSPPDDPAPPGCSDFHIHSADFVGVRALDDTFLPEPGPPCGYGIESTIELRTVTICEFNADCDDSNVCTVDMCTLSKCTNVPGNSGVECREAAGACDEGETCDGISSECPEDAFKDAEISCRADMGECDVEDFCDGQSAECADEKEDPTTECRASEGMCDKADKCDGINNACPADEKEDISFVCRAAVAICDKDDTCDGTNDACPAQDDKAPTSKVCRAAVAICDKDDTCDGTNDACPALDDKQPNTFVCRPVAGLCDIQEKCDGATNACPADVLAAALSVCRTAVDICDKTEQCTGGSAFCPVDDMVDCDDGNSCTSDFCLAPGGCDANPVADGTVCDTTGVCNMAICYEKCPVPTTDPYEPTTCIVATDLVAPGDVIINPGVEFVIPGGNSFTFDCNDSFLIKAGATVWIKFLGALLCLI